MSHHGFWKPACSRTALCGGESPDHPHRDFRRRRTSYQEALAHTSTFFLVATSRKRPHLGRPSSSYIAPPLYCQLMHACHHAKRGPRSLASTNCCSETNQAKQSHKLSLEAQKERDKQGARIWAWVTTDNDYTLSEEAAVSSDLAWRQSYCANCNAKSSAALRGASSPDAMSGRSRRNSSKTCLLHLRFSSTPSSVAVHASRCLWERRTCAQGAGGRMLEAGPASEVTSKAAVPTRGLWHQGRAMLALQRAWTGGTHPTPCSPCACLLQLARCPKGPLVVGQHGLQVRDACASECTGREDGRRPASPPRPVKMQRAREGCSRTNCRSNVLAIGLVDHDEVGELSDPSLDDLGGRRKRRGGILSILAAIAGGRSALGCNLLLPQPSPTSTAAAWPGCHPCGCLSLAAKGAALPIATYRVGGCWPARFTPAARRPPAAAPQAPRSPRGRPLLSRSAPRPAAQCGAMSD